jgi:peptidoglycan/LPS O-acetylase OafA/YrhL
MSDDGNIIRVQNTSQRYDALDGVRALACLGIVAMHVFRNMRFQLDGFIFSSLIPSFTNLVFLFMTISGFGMCCGYYDRMLNREIDIVDFYKKRYKKILPFFALLCLIEFVASPGLETLYEVFANLTLCFGLIPNANITVIGVGWFIGTVFAFYLLFPFFCFLLADKRRAWLSFFASVIMNYLCTYYFEVERKAIAYSFVYFMVGGLVYLYKDKVVVRRGMQILLLLLLLLAAIVYYSTKETSAVKPLTMILINAVVLIFGMTASSKSILNFGPLQFLGKISFEVYLCHMLIYRVVEKLHLLKITANVSGNYLIVYVLVMTGSVIFAVIGKRIIRLLPGDFH